MKNKICKICSHKTKKLNITLPLFRHQDFKTDQNNTTLEKCTNCQMVYNLKKPKNISNLFKKKSYALSKQTSHLINNNNNFKRRTFYQAEIIYKMFIKKKKISVLDIGCFDGQLLLDLSKFFNKYKLFGYDVNKHLKQLFPKKSNFYFITGNLNKINEKFDLIIMSHSLMYIKDLDSKLQIIKKLLNKDGIVYIQFPNLSINPFYSLMSDQFQFPTENSIKNVLKLNDFVPKIIKKKIFIKELIILAKKGKHKNEIKLINDSVYEQALVKIKNIKNKLSRIPNSQLTVLGTTINAAFVDEVLLKKINFFVDEQKGEKNILFRGKKVVHPNKLMNNIITILPYGKRNKVILNNFRKQYQGNYCLV